jgi:ribosomal peptide maturation radical SAM protein 1
MRVMLLSMPWHALERPSLGLSLLRAALERDGHDCEVRYLGFDFADSIGIDDYLWVHGALPYTAFAGDFVFTEALYGERPGADDAYLADVWLGEWQRTMAEWDRLRRIRSRVQPFLEHCDRLPWGDYDLVGFTSTFEQNVASLALAKRVAEAHPEVLIAFGGANWEGEMGEALHRRFDFVDVAASGEADLSFPALVSALSDGGDASTVPGLVVRAADGSSVVTGPGSPVTELDGLPVPTYDDFQTQLANSPAAAQVPPTLLLETSRGCWWGAKHHCTFCGLNGGSIAFRSKSADRVLDEIEGLRASGAISVAVVDNILDMHFFSTVLPELARRGAPVGLFYEVKANLTRQQVQLLARSGVQHVQPGVESLSDDVLKLMRKGTTALQNIQLLKWCAEYGVVPEWNFLYGFPREDPEEYLRMADLMESLVHLPPPTGHGPLRLDRFSPYHEAPEGFGMTAVRPLGPYRHLYDVEPAELMKIAYYFEFAYADGRDLGYVAPALDRVNAWVEAGRRGVLAVQPHPDGSAVVMDTRSGSPRGHSLEPWQAELFAAMDSVTTQSALVGLAVSLGETEEAALDFLHACLELRIAAQVGNRWLGLAVHDPPRWEEPTAPRPRERELVVLT